MIGGQGLDTVPNGQEISQSLAEDERWALAQRIVSSKIFVKAPQLRDILVYLCRRTLEDSPSIISEHEVGCNVLGRRPDFNPNEDNIVRVQVRHLRKKLEDYFISEGASEPVILTIPRGGYVPRFDPRTQPAASSLEPEEELAAADDRERVPSRIGTARQRRRWASAAILVLSVACLLSAALAFHYWKQAGELRAQLPAVEERIPQSDDVLWPRLFVPGQVTNVVVADSCFALVQDILGLDVPLRDFAGGSTLTKLADSAQDQKLRAALHQIARRQYTSLGDLNIVAGLTGLARRYNARILVRYARNLDTREFKSGNFVMIGSRRSIPMIELFEPQLSFRLEQDPQTHTFGFRDKSPQPGQQAMYGHVTKDKNVEESYAQIALVPNLGANGHVLMIAGITMEATEAAGDLAMSGDFSTTLANLMRNEGHASSPPYVEVLVQARTMPGMDRVSKIICHRWLAAQKKEP